jgi:glutathione-regulated potassium-efflux system ancillary protein KefC
MGLGGLLRTVLWVHGSCSLHLALVGTIELAGGRRPSSTTSVAVVYAVMLELGFQRHGFREGGAGRLLRERSGNGDCSWPDLLALYNQKTLDLRGRERGGLRGSLPFSRRGSSRSMEGRVSELEAKYLLFLLVRDGGIGGLVRQRSRLASLHHRNGAGGHGGQRTTCLIRRLRTLTFGLLTPFYFIRAGSFVSVPCSNRGTDWCSLRCSSPRCCPR